MKTMKKDIVLLLTLVSLMLVSFPLQAQKYACVNTEYILGYFPEYTQVLNKLNKFAEEWQQELETKQEELEALRQQYQQESYLLPDNLKQRRKDEIHAKETELRSLQQQHFGVGGDLDRKREELLKPVMDRLYGAIERVAHEKSYAFVFDKVSSSTIVYVADKYDISDQVLEMLGVKKGSVPAAGSQPKSESQGKGSPTTKGGQDRNNPSDKRMGSTGKGMMPSDRSFPSAGGLRDMKK